MRRTIILVAALLALIFPVLTTAQTTVRRVPAKQTSAASGAEMFKEYCAPCHGLSGRGDGPAAAALKDMPANLTTLSDRNGGKFPEAMVAQSIKAGPKIPAHGSAEMPVWGAIFRQMTSGMDQAQVMLRVHNLTEYIRTLQTQ